MVGSNPSCEYANDAELGVIVGVVVGVDVFMAWGLGRFYYVVLLCGFIMWFYYVVLLCCFQKTIKFL